MLSERGDQSIRRQRRGNNSFRTTEAATSSLLDELAHGIDQHSLRKMTSAGEWLLSRPATGLSLTSGCKVRYPGHA